jgi:hypothetical protein
MSWKKYGGTSHFDSLYALKNYSITTDNFTLTSAYSGAFTISGILHVTQTATIDGSLAVLSDISTNGNLYVNKDATIDGSLNIIGNIDISKSIYIGQNVTVKGTSNLIGDVSANSNLVIGDYVYLDLSHVNYLYSGAGKSNSNRGVNTGVGLNTNMNLNAALTISSEFVSGLIVYSGKADASNIICLNNLGNGTAAIAGANGSYFNFFRGFPINPTSNGSLQSINGGILKMDCSNQIILSSNTSICPPILGADPNKGKYTRINNESLVVYDTFDSSYLYYNYTNPLAKKGNAISAIAADISSTTFMNFTTPNKLGGAIGGGAYPPDNTKGIFTAGITTVSGYIPHHNIVTGNYPNRLRNVMGVNTYTPSMEYIMDINGPVNLQNGECFVDASLSIFQNISPRYAAFYKSNTQYGYVLCDNSANGGGTYTYPILRTQNKKGIYWDLSYIVAGDFTTTNSNVNCISVYTQSIAFLGTSNGYVLCTTDNGNSWNKITGTGFNPTTSIQSIHASYLNSTTIRVFCCIYDTTHQNRYFDIASSLSNFSVNPTLSLDTLLGITPSQSTYSLVDGADSSTYTWLVNSTSTGITIYQFLTSSPNTNSSTLYSYTNNIPTSIYVLNDNYVYVTITNGTNSSFILADLNGVISPIDYSSYVFKYIRAIDQNNILIQCSNNTQLPLYSTNGGNTFKPINTSILNSNGMAANILANLRYMISYDTNNLVSFNYTNYSCIVYYCYLPQLFNFGQNTVLNITGNANQSGVIHQW